MKEALPKKAIDNLTVYYCYLNLFAYFHFR